MQVFTMKTEISPEIQQVLFHESLSNYVLILASFSVLLIVTGVVFASVKANKIRRQIVSKRTIQNLISTDLNTDEEESAASDFRTDQNAA
jgi:hypothetical protein